MLRLRPAQRGDDSELMRALLFEAAYWRPDVARPPLEQALASPELARYVEDFGRPGDLGIVVEEDAEPLGAAWWRYFEAETPGYGFVDEATPEVSAAVLPGHRGRGIGTTLLRRLHAKPTTRESTASASAWSATTPPPSSTSASGSGRWRARQTR